MTHTASETSGFKSKNSITSDSVTKLPALNNCTLICVSGKMASGKNYICQKLASIGWVSLDADIFVHDAINVAQDKILTTFEPYAKQNNIKLRQTSNGQIDRKALGQLLFEIPELLQIQEAIVYPIITSQITSFINANKDKKIIINATLLFKTPELMQQCQHILFVKAPFFTRLNRARTRDQLSTRHILRRFKKQKNLLAQYKKTKIPLTIVKN